MVRFFAALTKWTALAFCWWFITVVFFSLFAGGGAGQAPQPQPELDRTVLLHVYGKYGTITGYVKPWIAQTYNLLFTITEMFLGLLVLVVIINAIVRKAAGLPFRMGKTPLP
ncbi:MAG TPA: hypothetical protein VNW15_09390 [Rhizomicrobium sp.]|jgi:hypothetical protein|nr:hypothetical protein [Rhizomicrobium sp.]